MSTEPATSDRNNSQQATGVAVGFFRVVARHRVPVILLFVFGCVAGAFVAPFSWNNTNFVARVAVDAIPDVSENQQILLTRWEGRTPSDIEEQITWPLTSELLGTTGVRTIRSFSAFGTSTLYIVFDEEQDFYDTRARLVEKLASLPADLLPPGVTPQLGPDATPLGQVFWYTLEGRDEHGDPAGGWSLDTLRTIQDDHVRPALSAVPGVAEVASVGGHVLEYHVDVDPRALETWDLTLNDVLRAVAGSNEEVGARELEINGVEYLIRGVGFVESVDDIGVAVVDVRDGVPVLVRDVAVVQQGPASRRGALDVDGAEAVGGVVVARYGTNPMNVLSRVRARVSEVQLSLPTVTASDGRASKLEVVPFYDRSELIERTVGTLERALYQQLLIAVLVVVLFVGRLRAAGLVSVVLPVSVLLTLLSMKLLGMTADVLALSGIAIAIGTMIDMGIVVVESVEATLNRRDEAGDSETAINDEPMLLEAVHEVASPVLTAAMTTVLSFLPVFMLTGAEGKLFDGLAATKSLALMFSAFCAVTLLPALVLVVYRRYRMPATATWRTLALVLAAGFGVGVAVVGAVWAGVLVLAVALASLLAGFADAERGARIRRGRDVMVVVGLVLWVLTALSASWAPLGAQSGRVANVLAVATVVGGLVLAFAIFQRAYPWTIRWVLGHRAIFALLPVTVVLWGGLSWFGADPVFESLPASAREGRFASTAQRVFPGLNREFMPTLDEGQFLYMPSTMPHASIGEVLEMASQLDMLISALPEVTSSVSKVGRAESALDPAPLSMLETVISYVPEFRVGPDGERLLFRVDDDGGFVRTEDGELVPDRNGRPWRNWREHISRPEDIWDEIVEVARVPGLTSAPMLQPISTRVVMLQSGIRAPMSVRLQGDDLDDLAALSARIERLLRNTPEVNADAVNADRPVGKPWIEVEPDRELLAGRGISMRAFQQTLRMAVGGAEATRTVEGRENHSVRIRYPRELRDSPEDIAAVQIRDGEGALIELGQLADIRFVVGPTMIRGEDGALAAHVMFDHAAGVGEVDAVNAVRARIDDARSAGALDWPDGVTFDFAGTWENTVRARATLRLVVPLVMIAIAFVLYLQFGSLAAILAILSSVLVALSGGMVMLWFCNLPFAQELPILGAALGGEGQALSVAVWVGFIALFGIATDDAVIMITRIRESIAAPESESDSALETIANGAERRVRACLMTTATTILALLPVLTGYGAGADIMAPMALPVLGGMTFELLTLFTTPVLASVLMRRAGHSTGASPQTQENLK